MSDLKYQPVVHDHEAFLERALRRQGFRDAYANLADEYVLAKQLLAARSQAGLTQEEVAESMGTTKSAVCRLETAGKHSPSVTTLKKYARAVGCEVEIRLVRAPRSAEASRGREPATDTAGY